MLAARKLGPEAEASFLDGTFLADRRTTLRCACSGMRNRQQREMLKTAEERSQPNVLDTSNVCWPASAGSTWLGTPTSCWSCRRQI